MEVSSEIYEENDYGSVTIANGNVISKYRFNKPTTTLDERNELQHDNESDIIVKRKKNEFIEIEHKKSSVLSEVGLQLWRGAFLLNDFILNNQSMFLDKNVLELGSGVGITSLVASMYSKKVLCTDINIGGILDLIRRNVQLNDHYQKYRNNIEIHELDFFADKWSNELEKALTDIDICFAADVIYDDDITIGFIKTILKLFKLSPKLKEMFIALEKRYVFADCVVAPMYEFFMKKFSQETAGILKYTEMSTNFKQYFDYEKCKELVLIKVNII